MSAANVGATARWIASERAGVPWTLLCTGRTAEDRACARHLGGLLAGAAPDRADLIAGIEDGAAEHASAYARAPRSQRVDLAGDLPFCRDVDRAGFAMVGDVRGDHVVLTKEPC